ncbi:endonuclease domain-containing protein [Cupriavidus pauculus]|uniref:endonuclease domain-containing protein n=1 Tax=Cupriavidus pauculus TaxID=82633 RepID=UPI001EE1B25D|nr:DUF559 domain-containing protein [Cupriavidus pauculus]GJG93243.1 hypothetical protein CBA19C6_02160 [Cupriavidus pauculus]
MDQRLALTPNPSPASGRGEQTNGANSTTPSPSPSGRGAGGEGRRLNTHEFARKLRTQQTPAEERLWYYLRDRRLLGLKFKRQAPIGPYIADFLCQEHNLIIEADGSQHGSLNDFDRDAWLREKGYTVLRFWNNQFHQEIDGVLETVRRAVLP